ncbi:hypothetical protein BB560_000648 [Smittium megazygosporum]|uniref:Uncharacterized protein n=1 Tax=Smittium megazygosporum TaxID=133381 RepID=A0A2T9ZJY9_9FUNG|nr:hypothetical protein BB560_000648 [Smittium megazygosporum]
MMNCVSTNWDSFGLYWENQTCFHHSYGNYDIDKCLKSNYAFKNVRTLFKKGHVRIFMIFRLLRMTLLLNDYVLKSKELLITNFGQVKHQLYLTLKQWLISPLEKKKHAI